MAISERVAPTGVAGEHEVPVIVASIMRPTGTTGVQTHFRQFRSQLDTTGVPSDLITSFSVPRALRTALFAPRKLIEPLSGSAGVWWYYRWHRALLARALKQRLASGQPVVIYAQSPTAAEAAIQARHNPCQRVVLAVHFGETVSGVWTGSGMIPAGGIIDRDIRARERRVIPRLDALVHVSADTRRDLLEQIPEASTLPYEVIPNFLRRPELSSRAPIRDIITIGTLEPRKNQRFIVDVVAEARGAGRDVTTTIVGDGPDRGNLESLATARGVADLIHFAGFVPNGARLIPDHRIYVHSATYESFCIAAAEGLSYGRPILAGAVGGLPEVYEEDVEGRFWPLDSPQRAAEILLEVLDDETTYRRMATAARAHFESEFDADVVVPRLYKFLQRIGSESRS